MTISYCGKRYHAVLPRQLKLAMKLTTLLLIVAFLQVQASGTAQQVNLNLKAAPLTEVFSKIKLQTGYVFFYAASDMALARPVTISIKYVPVTEAIALAMKDQPLTYTVQGTAVFVKAKAKTTDVTEEPVAPPVIDVAGKVTDETGKPVAGASVTVKGVAGKGVATDENGNFVLHGVDENAVLVVTATIIETLEIKISGKSYLEIVAKGSVKLLDEYVVKGYYSTTKKLNTGNVRIVAAKEIEKQPISDPLGALQGRVPGLFVEQTSGAPGRAFTINIRGENSIANGNDPLYIVDGVPFNSTPLNSGNLFGSARSTSPFNGLSPSDIESMTILKDADATAIYGSRGANGVILITTKKGKSGPTNFSFSAYHGVARVAKFLDMMNTEEYLSMRKEALANNNLQPSTTDHDLNGTYDPNRYTDWQDVMIGRSAVINELQGDISGGSERTQFRIGLGYRREGNVFPGDNYMTKINSLTSINHRSANEKFTANFSANYVTGYNKMPTADMTKYINLAPNSPALYDSLGNLNWQNGSWTNPFSEIVKNYIEVSDNLNASSVFGYIVLPDLKIETRLGYNKSALHQKNIIPFSSFNPTTPDPRSKRSISWVNSHVSTWLIEPQVSYNVKLGRGSFDILVGSTLQENEKELISHIASGFADDEQIESIIAGTTKNVSQYTPSQYKYFAVYGRIGYSLQNKYSVNMTARRDGSSRFGPGRQFGNFGAVGAAWIFSRETWFKLNHIISYGKLRASYGITGNDQLGDYKYLSSYSYTSSSYQGYTGLNPTQLTNKQYGWETVKKMEIALETSFFDDRLSFNASYYINRTGNQLIAYALPNTTGFSSVLANFPAIVQNSGLEFELDGGIVTNKDFRWASAFNISIPRSKLVSFPGIKSTSYATRYSVGMPMSVAYVYQYTGIEPATGLYTFIDQNNDGMITPAMDRSFIVTGQKYYGGWNNAFSYKSFQLDIFLSFVNQTAQNYLFGSTPGAFSAGQGNQIRSISDRSKFQPYTTLGGAIFTNNGLFNTSTARYTDASFIRFKNISFSWNFSAHNGGNKIINSGRLFITAQNLFTITNYQGFDPESRSNLTLPPLRIITAGVAINF